MNVSVALSLSCRSRRRWGESNRHHHLRRAEAATKFVIGISKATFFPRKSLLSPPPPFSVALRSFAGIQEAPERVGWHPLLAEMRPGDNPDKQMQVEDGEGRDSRSRWVSRSDVDALVTGHAHACESQTGCIRAAAPRAGSAKQSTRPVLPA